MKIKTRSGFTYAQTKDGAENTEVLRIPIENDNEVYIIHLNFLTYTQNGGLNSQLDKDAISITLNEEAKTKV